MKVKRKITIWIILFVSLLGVYTTYIERNLLIVKRHNVTINKNGDEKLKVVQITDIHLGEFYNLNKLEKVVQKINGLDADIVVFTGDLIDNASTYNEIDNIAEVLKQIKCKIGKYAIYGNHDYGGGAVRYYEEIMNKGGFKVLKNDGTSIVFKDKHIKIFGADDGLMGNHSVDKTMNGINNKSVNLLLLHEPDLVDKYSDYPVDLVLSGHSHGGQVYIPFYGPLKKNVLSEKYTKGLYKLDNPRGTKIYVNSGLGNTKVPFRLFNMPQISLFNLKI
ncbi:metallophosphoesterase [Clostridium sp. CF011]|uniref:metallophosphoesterase n=1 Tax=unclassified Clostridium TaxID=2614128 RepID=UPI001C0C783E|nr:MULTISPECIES: metallophosphoesterase [unclassified Clostridium]MBU3091207.1 metallophosphoesterase [Clostridium sp. CF011]MBW9146507.1 metallophosphoesterase [Clostridium sp. CM027]UVE39611.1 metallophosphoesterase [Clostridium sp. CM027]WAG68517.1 metallophosphoesterase [Clostridium sp. CF011]